MVYLGVFDFDVLDFFLPFLESDDGFDYLDLFH